MIKLQPITYIKNKMARNQYELPVRIFIEKVLKTLTMKFDYVIAVIQKTKNLENLSFKNLQGHKFYMNKKLMGS